MITVSAEDPNTPDALRLMEELSETLAAVTGSSGSSSFDLKDVCVPGALFAVARNAEGEAVGCGAFRPLHENIAEVKRMYAKARAAGVGTQILSYLENQAQAMGYSALWLETRLINRQAVCFYERRGYHRIPNYGKYAGRAEAVCFEKRLAED